MHIVQITPYFWPHRGGVETHVGEVSRELVKRGHRVTIITGQDAKTESLEEKKNDLDIYRIPLSEGDANADFIAKTRHKFHIWKWFWLHRNLLLSADLIQVHDVFWWLLPLQKLVAGKTYLTFHGWEGEFPIRWQAKLQRRIYSKLAKKVMHVGAWIEQFYGDAPNQVTYGGVRESTIVKTPKLKPPVISKNHPLKIVFIGRLSDDNDIEKYCELIRQLRTQIPYLEMTWVGDGAFKSVCEKLGKVTGWVDDPTSYLASSDLVFAASYLSLWEARAQEKITCAFFSNPLKEKYLSSFPGAESLMMSDSPLEMSEKIIELLHDSGKWKKISEAGHDLAKSHTWSQVTDQYYELWQLKK